VRLSDFLEHPTIHSALSGVTVDQHHIRPSNVEISNTSLLVYPLPNPPATWDISVPFDAQAVIFSLRSSKSVEEGDARAGVTGLASRNQFYTSTASLGGNGDLGSAAYNAIYSKAAGALNLSHKVFNTEAGYYVSLTDAWLVATGPATRVLRTYWTNYGGSIYTLSCYGEVGVLG